MQFVVKRSLRGVVAALCLWVGSAQAQPSETNAHLLQTEAVKALPRTPGELFAALPTAGETATAEHVVAENGLVKRARAVAVNRTYVEAMVGAAALTLNAEGALVGEPRQQVLALFDDLSINVVKQKQYLDPQGNIVWIGGIVDDPLGMALLVIDDGEITANITTRTATITIKPIGNGAHVIREMKPRSSRELFDPAARPARDYIRAPKPPVSDATTPAIKRNVERPQATTTLRIYVAYTAKALAKVPNMQAEASSYIAHMNTTFANSQIDAVAQLAGLEQVNYTEGTDAVKILTDLADQVGDFARINNSRAATQADIVTVIADYGRDSCGIGYLIEDLTEAGVQFQTKFGTNVVNADCGASTFTHEVGHNIGADHDRFIETNGKPGPEEFNFGYVDTTAKFMDVMAYDNHCGSLGFFCQEIAYFSNPNVNYQGRPTGIVHTAPNAADNVRKIKEILPLVAQFSNFLTSTPFLSVAVTGTGTVSSAPNGINCGTVCSSAFTGGTVVTLVPTAPSGWQFNGWGGACTGTGPCTVTVSSAVSVTASFVPGMRIGAVYASVQPQSQSFLRFANTGSTVGTVSVGLMDAATGDSLATWTSPNIAAGAALQVPITTVESALTPGTAKPNFYTASIRSSMTGYIQHVLYRPEDGTLTNLSTCNSGVTINATQVASVHSGLLENGFPSTIAITNTATTDTAPTTATLGIFDANNGVKLGTYTTAAIPRGTQQLLTVATIEAALNLKPTPIQYHYVVKIENAFVGTMQHLVNNQRAGVITDMTTLCAFGTVAAPSTTVTTRRPGPIFSSTQGASQSFLRFYNNGQTAGTVRVTLNNYTTGTVLGTWTSPTLPAGASAQYQITIPEAALGNATKPQYYATSIQTQVDGFFQHVLYRPLDGTLTNLSTCDAGVTAAAGQLINVHSSLLDFGFPSSIVIVNPSAAAQAATLAVYDAVNGARLGAYTSPSIAPNAQISVPIADIQSAISLVPNQDQYHYVIRTEGGFAGFLQHLVNNKTRGVITDMSTMCSLPAKVATF
jgi:hypothetical protein